MKPFSEDLRERIIKGRQQGESVIELSKRFSISKSSVERYCRLHQRTGQCIPKKIGGYRRSRLEGHDKTLQSWIKKKSDMTLAQMQARCLKEMNIRIGINALWHRIDQLNLSYKKNAARRGAKPA